MIAYVTIAGKKGWDFFGHLESSQHAEKLREVSSHDPPGLPRSGG